jgi:hypothetical protein
MNFSPIRTIRALGFAACFALLTGCISASPPKYQPGVDNTQTLLRKGNSKLSVGTFKAAPGIKNSDLSVRGSKLTGGSDGTFSSYLREALITELKEAGRYNAESNISISGTLTENKLAAAIKTGTADVAAQFVVTDNGHVNFDKSLTAHQEWPSSFVGTVAIPAAMRNYAAAVQKLLGLLFNDPAFAKATAASNQAQANNK